MVVDNDNSWRSMVINGDIHSGKLTVCKLEITIFKFEKSTISTWAMFNSYVATYERLEICMGYHIYLRLVWTIIYINWHVKNWNVICKCGL